jgi:hypothetical protein
MGYAESALRSLGEWVVLTNCGLKHCVRTFQLCMSSSNIAKVKQDSAKVSEHIPQLRAVMSGG